jgi:diaminohydroxyphosphoribosylaminopyrimidine deaminase/5-amino-6-(5-phosphoribosylamino)uracil reductase
MAASRQFTDFDRRAMARALELAERGAETTHPNPRVGCVIARGEQIIAEGWHERAGGPHAEVAALRALASGTGQPATAGAGAGAGPSAASKSGAGDSAAAGATVYVTLEPCSHHGRTPPCVDALISARVGRVVFAIKDPNPQVAGRGAEALMRAGIEVSSGLMEAEAEEMNAGFFMRMRTGRPFVRVKVGMSLDGRTALANGASKWITGEAARNDVQHWRARSSAVLTGIGTVLADDPRLDVRLPGASRQPLRVVLDTNLRTPPTARLLEADPKPLIFTASHDADRIAALRQRGAQIERVDIDSNQLAGGALSQSAQSQRPRTADAVTPAEARAAADAGARRLRSVLARLGQLAINDLLVEAGPTVTGAFVQHGLADELLLYIAPRLLGPQARPLFELPPLEDLQQAQHFGIIDQRMIGTDLRLRLRPA